MSSFLWHTIADMSANLLAITDEGKNDLWRGRYQYDYQTRGVATQMDKYGWTSYWPSPKMMGGDPITSPFMLGQENGDGMRFELSSTQDSGTARPYFVMGQCVTSVGAGLANCAIELFLTSNNALVSTGVTDALGYYQMPTPYAGQTHFVVANYSNGTYVGASVSTLTPNF